MAKPKELSDEQKQQIAKEDYKYWMNKTESFLIKYKTLFDMKKYNDSAFEPRCGSGFVNPTLMFASNYQHN